MAKKPEPPVIEVAAKKVVDSKIPVAPAPLAQTRQTQPIKAESGPARIIQPQINQAEVKTPPSEEDVRLGAYLRWDAAGRPGGDGVHFWLEAEQELLAGNAPLAGKSMQKR